MVSDTLEPWRVFDC